MPSFLSPAVAEATYLLEFTQPVVRMRFEQARAEEAFAALVSSQSQQTNLPDTDDPMAPRLVFEGDKKAILISQLRCQMDFRFERGKSVQASLDIIERHATTFHEAAVTKFAVAPFSFTALILTIQMPKTESGEPASAFIFDQLVKAPALGQVASAQVALGFRRGDHFLNLAVDGYETRRLKVEEPGTRWVKKTDFELLEAGLRVRVDVNDRAASGAGAYSVPRSPAATFRVAREFLEQDFEKFSGFTWK